MKTVDFFATHPVFSLDEATKILAPKGARLGTVERLKYHLKAGRLKLAARGVYAVVPLGLSIERFQPDPFLVAAAVRPDGIFSHHSALELLGTAHSVWHRYTIFVDRRRRPLSLNGMVIRFLEHPLPIRSAGNEKLGTIRVERLGKVLSTTGPERTLVEGFRRPGLTGGLEELIHSASGFSTLDLEVIEKLLCVYGICNLWAAVGWFLERFQKSFYVPEKMLERLARNRPRSPQYLERDSRGGVMASRWNLILPRTIAGLVEHDESQP